MNVYLCEIFDNGFAVKHYAGDVNYTAKNFCDRNKDTMSMDVVAHLQGTKHKLVKMFFPPPEAGDEKRRPTTTAFKIKSQAQKLVKTLLECSPHYVRYNDAPFSVVIFCVFLIFFMVPASKG